jgi:hypothetical protein
MKFAPKPENEFYEFIRTYYRECHGCFPKIEAIAGKWMYRDLIPGLSDFDSRFIVADGMCEDDWIEMSTQVGQVHLDLCRQHPCWSRMLEHLPGINLTWSELISEANYYPEYKQWTFYNTLDPERVSSVQSHFLKRGWNAKDEYYHLKRFCTYYGRYNRSIDLEINLHVQKNKYPLHSRIMHYFNPPVHSAICLMDRNNMPGKMNAFELAREYFPDLPVWDPIDEILDNNYKITKWYSEPHLSSLEDMMEDGLGVIASRLRRELGFSNENEEENIIILKRAVEQFDVDPILRVFESCRFSRLMKGRLYFYLNVPPFFDSSKLIQIELGRIGNNFFKIPFQAYWKIKTGEDNANPSKILDGMNGDPLTEEEYASTKEFAKLTSSDWHGKERLVTEQIVSVYDSFYKALSKMTTSLKDMAVNS